MILPRLLKSLFPASRGPLHWRELIPLVAFLLVYAVVIAGLQYGWNAVYGYPLVLFSRPWAFLLIAASIWVWWLHRNGYSGLNRRRAVVAFVVRLTLLGLFVAVLAEPRSVRTSDSLAVVYVLDMSDSIDEPTRDDATEFVAATMQRKQSDDAAGLVTFGSNATVELPPRSVIRLDGGQIFLNSRIDRGATNIEQSLSLAMALLPEDKRGRIVLVSDGTETAGNLHEVLDDLRAREIAVDVLPLHYSYDREVWIERMELPQEVKIAESYRATLVVSSLQAGAGRLVIRENGQEIASEEIEFQSGKNRVDIPIMFREPGYYEYSASLQVSEGEDVITDNNEAIGYIYVQGEGRVLLVTEPGGDPRDWQTFAAALRAAERDVEVIDAYDFPDNDPLALMPYDCVVFVNVAHDAFVAPQLQSLHDAVYNQGLGFLMVGGANSFGPGGYHNSLVEDVLPVSMDISKKKVLPKGALAIILHTCEFAQGNTWGKRITKRAIQVLGAEDEVGVLALLADREGWLFELTPAADYESLVPLINAAEIGDMGAFGNTMQMGLDALIASDAATRHMIIISDGDPQPPSPELVQQFIDAQVSVSMVAVFPHGGIEVTAMRNVASATGGRYYFPSDPAQLPSIFIKEAKTLKRSMIQNETIDLLQGHPSGVMEGINALPQLHGYVLTSLKENRPVEDVLLTVPDEEADGESDPVLAIWRYGLGTTAAFTSDLSPNWGSDWVNWDQYEQLVSQLIVRISRVRSDSHLRLATFNTGTEGAIRIEDYHPEATFLDVVAQVIGPDRRTETVTLRQTGPGRYQSSFPLWGKGRYQVTAIGRGGDREDRAHGGFIVSYSPEYTHFRSNWSLLREIMEATGGTELSPVVDAAQPEQIFNRRQPKQSSQPVFDWLLIALACLVPIDVGMRRVQLDWSVVKGWLGMQRRGESTQMMGALLARKQQVEQAFQQPASPRGGDQPSQPAYPVAQPRPPVAPRSAAPATKPKTPAEPQPSDPENKTTTSRLLDMKKRRQQDQPPED